jgi:acetyl esterase/lipase
LSGRGWAWTAPALALLAGLAVLGIFMLHPVRWDLLPGTLAAMALAFPLHLLVVAAAAGGLALLARRRGARLAAAAFGGSAALAAVLAVAPCVAVGLLARREGVPLSLAEYLARSTRPNLGSPDSSRAVEYAVAPDGMHLHLDVWRAGTEGIHPAVVIVHGGGWKAGARGQFPEWNRWLNGLGYHVFDVDYRLAPPVRWRDAVEDVQAALAFVAANAGRWGVDRERIHLWGHSAGGHLALLAAYGAGDPAVRPRSVVCLYGLTDLAPLYGTGPSPAYGMGCLDAYLGGSPETFADRYAFTSPLARVGPDSPPTILVQGTTERIVPVEQAGLLDRALAKAGVDHETWLLPATDHVFDLNWGGFATQFARDRIRRFLERQDRR